MVIPEVNHLLFKAILHVSRFSTVIDSKVTPKLEESLE